MSRLRLLGLGLVAAAFVVAFWRVTADLISEWNHNEYYSHAFLIVPLALYVVWRQRAELAAIPGQRSASGLVVLIGSLLFLGIGQLGADAFLTRIALLGAIAGAAAFLWSFRHLKAVAFAFLLLLLAIPIPAILLDRVAFPLQLMAARFGEAVISACGIPALREGNVIILANTTLEVAEECSGIWSLLSLLLLAAIWGYLLKAPPWLRWLLVAASVPIALLGNGIRVAGTGIAVHLFGPDAAKGFPHLLFGWLVFVGAWALLLAVQHVAAWIWPSAAAGGGAGSMQSSADSPVAPPAPDEGSPGAFLARAVVIALCLGTAAGGLRLLTRPEAAPQREPLVGFPLAVGDWRARAAAPPGRNAGDEAGFDEHLSRSYAGPSQQSADLYVRYSVTQRQGQTLHSMLNSMPGLGWEPIDRSRVTLEVPGSPLAREVEVNRVVVQRGVDRAVVYYWYQARGRVVANEYRARIRAVADAILLNRSDGAVVRITVPVDPRATRGEEESDRAARDFVRALFPVLGRFLPA